MSYAGYNKLLMMNNRAVSCLAAILIVSMMSPASLMSPASAESFFLRNKNESVLQRQRPEYDPAGIRAGSFIIRPRIEAIVAYSDNVFAVSEDLDPVFGEQDDVFFILRPGIDLQSNWSRHEFNIGGYVQRVQHIDFDDETTADFGVYTDGRLDVNRHTALFGGVTYENLHESRGVATTALIPDSPIEYQQLSFHIGGQQEFGRFRYLLRADFDDYAFDDSRDISTNALIDQGFRDVFETILTGQADIALTRDTAIFLQASWNDRDHDQDIGSFGNRDSDGFNISTGIDFDISRLARGRIALGYLQQDYVTFGEVSGASVDTFIEWYPTRLTTVSFDASRGVRDSALFSASTGGFIETEVGLRVDQEILRNVILSAGVSVGEDDYDNIDRTDDRLQIDVGGQYLINRLLRAKLEYIYTDYDTDVLPTDSTLREFDSNTILLSLVAEK